MIYLKGVKSLLKHKFYIGAAAFGCTSILEFLRITITHDMIKLRPKILAPYCKYLYSNNKEKYKQDYIEARKFHHKTSKHHYEYWDGEDMPNKYLKEMLIDWMAVSIELDSNIMNWYISMYNEINVSKNTRVKIDYYIGLTDEKQKEKQYTWKDICEAYDIDLFDIRYSNYSKIINK